MTLVMLGSADCVLFGENSPERPKVQWSLASQSTPAVNSSNGSLTTFLKSERAGSTGASERVMFAPSVNDHASFRSKLPLSELVTEPVRGLASVLCWLLSATSSLMLLALAADATLRATSRTRMVLRPRSGLEN